MTGRICHFLEEYYKVNGFLDKKTRISKLKSNTTRACLYLYIQKSEGMREINEVHSKRLSFLMTKEEV